RIRIKEPGNPKVLAVTGAAKESRAVARGQAGNGHAQRMGGLQRFGAGCNGRLGNRDKRYESQKGQPACHECQPSRSPIAMNQRVHGVNRSVHKSAGTGGRGIPAMRIFTSLQSRTSLGTASGRLASGLHYIRRNRERSSEPEGG